MRSEALNVRVSPEIKSAAARLATADNRTLSQWVVLAIEEKLERENTMTTAPATQLVTVTPRTKGFSFAYGPATTKGIDLLAQTDRTTIGSVSPEPGMQNVLMFNGKLVVGVDGERFRFGTDGERNAQEIRDLLEFGAVTIEVEP